MQIISSLFPSELQKEIDDVIDTADPRPGKGKPVSSMNIGGDGRLSNS